MILSKNAVGLVTLLFATFGLNVVENDIVQVLSAIGTVISFGLMIWNQIDRKDVDLFFFKK